MYQWVTAFFRTSQFTDPLTEFRPAAIGQKLMGHTLPAEAACGDTMIDMGPDKSVLILIKHCQDMKQQETRLRLSTLLLLLSCTALFIFAICADLRQHESSESSGQGVSSKTFSYCLNFSLSSQRALTVSEPLVM